MASAGGFGAIAGSRYRSWCCACGTILTCSAKTDPSELAKAKKATKRSADDQRVMGFADLMRHLGTLTRNTMRVPLRATHRFTLYLKTTSLQEAALYSTSNRCVSSRPKAQAPIYLRDRQNENFGQEKLPSAASRAHMARGVTEPSREPTRTCQSIVRCRRVRNGKPVAKDVCQRCVDECPE
jgi:hypothetical protein